MKAKLAFAMGLILMGTGAANNSDVFADSEVSFTDVSRDASSFEVKPYLFAHGTGSLGVNWRYASVNVPAEAPQVQVYLGPTLTRSVPAHFDGVSWAAELAVAECGIGEGISYFVPGMTHLEPITPIPCPGEHKTARFSFIADAQEGPEFLEDIAKEMAKFPGSAILSDGDLVQEGASIPDWVDYFRALSSLGGSRTTFAAIGNHEYRSTPQTNYFENFFRVKAPDAHYSSFLGDMHLIVLNSNFEDDKSLVEAQIDWLKQELARPAKWKVVMFHHAPYSSGISDGPVAIRKEHIVLRERYVPLFEAYRIDLVLSGHTHIFERSVKDGIQYLVGGPAGGKMGIYGARNPYSIRSLRLRTVTHFEINESSLHAVTLAITGEILDDFTLHR